MPTAAEAERIQRAEVLGWALGRFERFAGLLDIVPKGGARQKLRLNEIQRKYSAQRTARDVVLKPRQIGFTTLEQARDIYHFLTVPGARVVVTCQSLTEHDPLKVLSKNYRVMFESLERAGLQLKFHTQSAGSWVLADRDASLRIVEAGASEAAAEKKGRAGTISRLHLTETAFYEYADETLNAMLECVPGAEHGSEIVNESTPNGAAGFFYRQCKNAGSGLGAYKLHFFPWYAASEYAVALEPGELIRPQGEREDILVERGISAEQLKWYRAKVQDKGQDKVDQEYPSDADTCFLVSGRGFFDQQTTTRLLEKATDPVERRDHDRISIWVPPRGGRRYIIAADTSEGSGGDSSGAVVRDVETAELCAALLGQYTPWQLAEALAKLGTEYNEALIAVERNNHGHSVLQALEREQRYPRIYYHVDGKAGWLTSSVTRPTMLDALEDAYRKGHWTTPHRDTLAQFRVFIISATGKPQAANGEHDDMVIAEAICWSVRGSHVSIDWDELAEAQAQMPKAVSW
jgi:hypothetical protein